MLLVAFPAALPFKYDITERFRVDRSSIQPPTGATTQALGPPNLPDAPRLLFFAISTLRPTPYPARLNLESDPTLFAVDLTPPTSTPKLVYRVPHSSPDDMFRLPLVLPSHPFCHSKKVMRHRLRHFDIQ